MLKKSAKSPSKSTISKNRFMYDPLVIYKAHIYNKYFMKDVMEANKALDKLRGMTQEEKDLLLSGEVEFTEEEKNMSFEEFEKHISKKYSWKSDEERENFIKKERELIACFAQKYPLWLRGVPAYWENFIEEMTNIKSNEMVLYINNWQPVRVIHNYCPVSTYIKHRTKNIDSTQALFSKPYDDLADRVPTEEELIQHKRYLRIDIDLFRNTDGIMKEIHRIISHYKNELGFSKTKNRNRTFNQLVDLDNYRLKMEANENKQKPMLPGGKEGERLRRKIDRSCQKVKKIFLDLGLPVE